MATSEAIAAAAHPAAPPPAATGASPDADTTGAGDWDPVGPSMDDMQAMMDTPDGATGDAPATPAEGAPPAAPSVPAIPAETPKPTEPAAPAEPVAATADGAKVAADLLALRKGWAALAKDKESLVTRTQEAKGAIERAKQFEQKAAQFDSIPKKFAADPLGFVIELSGAKTIEDQEAFISGLLDKVIEREKSPVEREIARLKQEMAQKEEALTRTKAESDAKAAQEKNDQIIREWTARNIGYAESTPELADKYDLIVSLGQGEAVHQTCLAYHQKYGVILDPAQAADAVEAHLRKGAEKSKYLKSKFGVSPPAPAAPPARPSNGTSAAPKQSGNTPTLSALASEGSAPSAAGLPEDDNRFDAVLREMQASGELPDEWRVSGPGH